MMKSDKKKQTNNKEYCKNLSQKNITHLNLLIKNITH